MAVKTGLEVLRDDKFCALEGQRVGLWSGQSCNGMQVHITELARWRPVEIWLGVLITIAALYPEQFAWLPAHPDTGNQYFDRLIGGRWVRRQITSDIQAGKDTRAILAQLASEWFEDRNAFELQRRPHLLYI